MNKPDRVFDLSISIDVSIAASDLWPDGDGPENPTVQDVENLIKDCGGWDTVLTEWNLIESLRGTVIDQTEFRERLRKAAKTDF